MSESNNQQPLDPLDLATKALRDAPVPTGPPTELTAATVAAIQSQLAGTVPTSTIARPRRRRRVMHAIGFGTATAAVIALATGVVWFDGSVAAHAQKALDNATKATSVKVTMTMENKGKVTEVRILTRQGDAVRAEIITDAGLPDKPVMIVDLKTRKQLTLLPKTKIATRSELGAQEAQAIAGMLGDFAGLKSYFQGDEKALKVIGEEKLGDRKTMAYEITATRPEAGVWKVWVDPKTDLPVRLRLPGAPKQSLTLDFEDWNKKFDAKLFSQEVPNGYKLPQDKK